MDNNFHGVKICNVNYSPKMLHDVGKMGNCDISIGLLLETVNIQYFN